MSLDVSVMEPTIQIEELIEIVRRGGVVKTGVDVYSKQGVLLLEKNVVVRSINSLLTLKQNGLLDVPVDQNKAGGIWDTNGNLIEIEKRLLILKI